MTWFIASIYWIIDISRWSKKKLSQPLRCIYRRIKREKFVKIIVCGWIIYAECNLINYLWCVGILGWCRKEYRTLDTTCILILCLSTYSSHWKCWCHLSLYDKKKRRPNQTWKFSAIDFRKCDINGSNQKFSYQNKVHKFSFYYLKTLFIT